MVGGADEQARAHALPPWLLCGDGLEIALELGELRPMPLAPLREYGDRIAAGEDLQDAFLAQLRRRELGRAAPELQGGAALVGERIDLAPPPAETTPSRTLGLFSPACG